MPITSPIAGTPVATGANTTATLSVQLPAGVKVGDLLELSVGVTTASATADATFTPPSGFVSPGSNFKIRDDTAQAALYFKMADSTDVTPASGIPPSVQVGVAGHNGRLIGEIVARPGVGMPTNADGATGVNATSVQPMTAALTFSKIGWFVMVGVNRSIFTYTPGTGLTERADLAVSNTGLAVFDSNGEVPIGSASRTITASGSSSAGAWIAYAAYPAEEPFVQKSRVGNKIYTRKFVGPREILRQYQGTQLIWGRPPAGTIAPPAGGGFKPVTDFTESYRPEYVIANSGVGKVDKAPDPNNSADWYEQTAPDANTTTITSSNITIRNKVFRWRVKVSGWKVTFVNCIFEGRGLAPTDEKQVVDTSEGRNVEFYNCEIYSWDAYVNKTLMYGVNGVGTKNFQTFWCNIHHVIDGMRVNIGTAGSWIDETQFGSTCDWIHDILLQTPDLAYGTRSDNKTHSEPIQIQSGRNGYMHYSVLDGWHSIDGSSNVTVTDSVGKVITGGNIQHPQSTGCLQITNDGFDNLELIGCRFKGGDISVNGADGLTNSSMADCRFVDGSPFLSGTNGYLNHANDGTLTGRLTRTNNKLITAGTTI